MIHHRESWKRLPFVPGARRLLPLLLLPVALTLWSEQSQAAQPAALPDLQAQPGQFADQQAAPPAARQVVVLDLAGCLHVALEKHPKIAAQRAALAAAQSGLNALETLKVPALLVPELPIRRQQAAAGVNAAQAAVAQAERAAVYAVTRNYFAVLYAREQQRVTNGVVDRLGALYGTIQSQLKGGAKDITINDARRTRTYQKMAETRRVQAIQGEKRALAALREAMGVGPDFCFTIPQGPLPQPQYRLCKEELVSWALARRGDLIQAGIYVEVTGLEIQAQGMRHVKRMETFASGSDIHSKQVPETLRQPDRYRPGGIPPEMPTTLVGSRAQRMQHAAALYARAVSVLEDTRGLIVLEAEDAYYRWEDASGEIATAREAADSAEQWANDASKDYTSGSKIKIQEVVESRILAAQARGSYNEQLFNLLVVLADLERITGGAFCAHLPEWEAAARNKPADTEKKGAGDDLFGK